MQIIPRFTHAAFQFISVGCIVWAARPGLRCLGVTVAWLCTIAQGNFGPFRPGNPVDVPLWLAVRLKSDSKCNLVCPEWMTAGVAGGSACARKLPTPPHLPPPPSFPADELRETYAQETKDDTVFAPLPFHYLEVSSLILHACVILAHLCVLVRV